MWKIENLHNEVGDIAKDISTQSVVRTTWLLLTACSKIGEEREKLNKERNKLGIIEGLGLVGLKNEVISYSQTHMVKKKKSSN